MTEKKPDSVATIDTATGLGRRFQNRLFEFGAAWLGDIDKKVAKGDTAQGILDWLKSKYSGPLPMPTRKTVQAYVKWRRQALRVTAGAAVRIRLETERTESELKEMLLRLQIGEMEIGDRKVVLEKMVRFLLVRTERISQVQENLLDPRFEQAITNHLGLVKTTVDTLLKMEGQIGAHEFIARRIVEMFLADMAPILKQAAEDTYGPEKLKAFLERVNKGYARIDFVRIKKDAAMEAASLGTEEVLDAVAAIRPVTR